MTTQPEIHRKVDDDDPNRCQAVNNQGQCHNIAVPGGKVCMVHGGNRQDDANKLAAIKNYRLTKWKSRVDDFADNPNVKSLREEVGITRLQLEELMSKCENNTDLLMYSDRIAKLITQIQGLVLSCQKLEEKAGTMLDKTQLFVIAEAIVVIISDHVTDPDALSIISGKIADTLTKSIATDPLK